MPKDPFRKWYTDGDAPADIDVALESHTHPGGGTLHADLTDVSSDQHHPQSHTHASHTGIGANDHHTAFVQADADARYSLLGHTHGGGSEAFPVGAVYINITGTNPNTELGYGTWSQIAAGRMLIGQDTGDTDFDVLEETGGAKTHVHTDNLSHTGAAVADHADVLNHVHNQTRLPTATGGSTGFTVDTSMSGTPATTSVNTGNPTANGVVAQVHGVTQPSAHGSHAATDSKPPYFVVSVWKRTA
jgi:hypothetical protein